MIKPEIGMPVLYHPHGDDHFNGPCAGVIAKVWGDNCVNLAIVDGNGLAQNRTSVLLHMPADGEPNPAGGRWCQFPNWFLRLMAPPMVVVNRTEFQPSDHPNLRYPYGYPWETTSHQPPQIVPAGTPDRVYATPCTCGLVGGACQCSEARS